MSKFTPGPWGVDIRGHDVSITSNEKGRPYVALVLDSHYMDDGQIANANLIASAPDLFLQLRELVLQVQGFQDCNGDKGFVLTGAIAAITKAGGSV